jgi:pimeloyl-ACP methyl ester carboxylesterase
MVVIMNFISKKITLLLMALVIHAPSKAMDISNYYKPIAATVVGAAIALYTVDTMHDYIARYGRKENGIDGIKVLTDASCQSNNSNITYLFSHGLADSHKQARKYLPAPNAPFETILNYPCATFDYPDACYSFLRVNRKETSLAQDNEIEKLSTAFAQTAQQSNNIVLMGISRGASTIVTFMALNNPEQVKALVLESPFDCMDSVVNDKLNRIGLADTTTAQTMGLALTRFIFTKFSPQGIRPADVAHKIRHNLPILIVCSQQDQLVPASSSAKLYTILRNSGHTQVHLLTLPEGKHAKLFNSAASSLQYKQVTHAFYKKYGLPHDEKLAFEGQKTFLECQPIFSI